jgi:hypothetical protein
MERHLKDSCDTTLYFIFVLIGLKSSQAYSRLEGGIPAGIRWRWRWEQRARGAKFMIVLFMRR